MAAKKTSKKKARQKNTKAKRAKAKGPKAKSTKVKSTRNMGTLDTGSGHVQSSFSCLLKSGMTQTTIKKLWQHLLTLSKCTVCSMVSLFRQT